MSRDLDEGWELELEPQVTCKPQRNDRVLPIARDGPGKLLPPRDLGRKERKKKILLLEEPVAGDKR